MAEGLHAILQAEPAAIVFVLAGFESALLDCAQLSSMDTAAADYAEDGGVDEGCSNARDCLTDHPGLTHIKAIL